MIYLLKYKLILNGKLFDSGECVCSGDLEKSALEKYKLKASDKALKEISKAKTVKIEIVNKKLVGVRNDYEINEK